MINSIVYDLAHSGNVEGVKAWLISNPDALNTYIDEGFTLIHIACIYGHEDLLAYLLDRGALVNIDADNLSRNSPLHLAVAYRDEEAAARMARMLIDNGAELNAMQSDGQTPLHHAVGRRSELLVNTLIEAGADPFLKDNQGRSASDLGRDLKGGEMGEVMMRTLKRAFSLPLETRE